MTNSIRHREIQSRESKVDERVVADQPDQRFEREPDLASWRTLRRGWRGAGASEEHQGPKEGEDGDGAEAEDDGEDSGDPIGVTHARLAADGGGALEEEEVNESFGDDEEGDAELDAAVAIVVGWHAEVGEVYGGGEDEHHGGNVDGDGQDALEGELAELGRVEDVEARCYRVVSA